LINSREVSAVVRNAVMEIDERYRVAMLLKDVDGLSAAEIAAALDIPVGTVESRASRGREQLKQRLTKLMRSGKLP
jgi:RNA polymerase sigma-70 factor (ECF subfamily)